MYAYKIEMIYYRLVIFITFFYVATINIKFRKDASKKTSQWFITGHNTKKLGATRISFSKLISDLYLQAFNKFRIKQSLAYSCYNFSNKKHSRIVYWHFRFYHHVIHFSFAS